MLFLTTFPIATGTSNNCMIKAVSRTEFLLLFHVLNFVLIDFKLLFTKLIVTNFNTRLKRISFEKIKFKWGTDFKFVKNSMLSLECLISVADNYNLMERNVFNWDLILRSWFLIAISTIKMEQFEDILSDGIFYFESFRNI